MCPSTIPTPTGIRCGNRTYHGDQVVYHASAAAVRECYALSGRFAPQSSGEVAQTSAVVQVPAPAPVPAERLTFQQFREANEFFDGELSDAEERAAYQRYLGQAQSPAEAPAAPAPASESTKARTARYAAENAARYATWATIPVENDDYAHYALHVGSDVKFYRVRRPSTGKYAGRTYIDLEVSDETIRMPWKESASALDRIAADPMAAAVLYGQETKRCAICHRRLTQQESRERGIGPKCLAKVQG